MIDLERLHHSQLEILKEVDRICHQNNINYTITAGTLLGAIRHQGFIPWDDDLDIGMTRKDYEYFLKIAPASLNSEFKIMTMYNNQYYGLPFAKVMLKNTRLDEANLPKKIEGYGIFIDVFPFDNAPLENQNDYIHKYKIEYYKKLLLTKTGYRIKTSPAKQFIYYLFKIIAFFYTKDCIIHRLEKEIIRHNDNGNDLLYNKCDGYNVEQLSKDALENAIKVKFESFDTLALNNWDYYLTSLYGDYMKIPPKKLQNPVHQYRSVVYRNKRK